MSDLAKLTANEKKAAKERKSGGLVSIDTIIDDIGRRALEEARRKEETERIRREQAERRR
jgi:hypothetical protein